MTLEAKVKQLQSNPVFKAGNGLTHCNSFVHACALALGCDALELVLANEMVATISRDNASWMPVTPSQAQRLANRGFFVVAGAAVPNGHGHVAVVVPGNLCYSGNLKSDAPVVASVGSEKATFYGKHAGWAFTASHPPEYWMWIGFPIP